MLDGSIAIYCNNFRTFEILTLSNERRRSILECDQQLLGGGLFNDDQSFDQIMLDSETSDSKPHHMESRTTRTML